MRNYLSRIWHQSALYNNEILRQLVEPQKQARILDLGCDNGSLTLERIRGKITNPEIYGLEINPKSAKTATAKGIKVSIGTAEKKLPFKTGFFDMVSANQIIEHLINTDLFLAESYRVLKKGGYLLLSTENLSSWHNIFALALGWQPFSQDVSNLKPVGNPFKLSQTKKPAWALHTKVFTLKSLCEAARLHRFNIEKIFGAGYYPLPEPLSTVFSTVDPYHSAFIGFKSRK